MLNIEKEKVTVMVVDDELINLRIVDSMLKNEGFQTLLVQNSGQVTGDVRQKRPDIVLLDVSMPEKDGFTVCREIKSDPEISNTPVLFLSGQTGNEFVVRGLEAGAQDYITKPFSASELIARVETHLKLKIMFEKLIEAEQVKALNAAMVSQNHELNQLTTSILGQVEILELIMKRSPECQKCLDGVIAIEKAALEMSGKIEKFTNISRIRYSKYSDKTDMIDLNTSSAED